MAAEHRILVRAQQTFAAAVARRFRDREGLLDVDGLARHLIEMVRGTGAAEVTWILHSLPWLDERRVRERFLLLVNSGFRTLRDYPKRTILSIAGEARQRGQVEAAEHAIGILVSPTHARLVGERPAGGVDVQAGLARHGARLQSITQGEGSIVYDEYSVVVDAMPITLRPRDFLAEMATDLNSAINNDVFDEVNEFRRRRSDARRGPGPGDVYDIDIRGPDNGSVVLVERTPSRFVFQTVYTSETGQHPEYGSREFGYEVIERGRVRFYTRGASRPGGRGAIHIGMRGVGGYYQRRGWTALIQGIANQIRSRGGHVTEGVRSWRQNG